MELITFPIEAPCVGKGEEFTDYPVPSVEKEAIELISKGRVLDVGCGNGGGIKRFALRGYKVTGLDIEASLLKRAREKGEVVLGDSQILPFGDSTFDIVLCSCVLHHLENPEICLREIKRVLKNKGLLILAEPVEDNIFLRIARNLDAKCFYCKVRMDVKSRFYMENLENMLGGAGLKIMKKGLTHLVSGMIWYVMIEKFAFLKFLNPFYHKSARNMVKMVPSFLRHLFLFIAVYLVEKP